MITTTLEQCVTHCLPVSPSSYHLGVTLPVSPSSYHLGVTLPVSPSRCHPPSVTLPVSPSRCHPLGVTLPVSTSQCTEVGRAFLNQFQKSFLNKVLIRIEIARKFKFYMRMVISGSKNVKKGQKILKRATIWTYSWFFQKFFALANLIHINSYNKRKKSVMSLYTFRTYFFTLREVQASFSNLLTTANNYRKFLCDFF